jgi:hypothetical protein
MAKNIKVGQKVWLQGQVGQKRSLEDAEPPCQAEVIGIDDDVIMLREIFPDGSLDMTAEIIIDEEKIFTDEEWAGMSNEEKFWDPSKDEE